MKLQPRLGYCLLSFCRLYNDFNFFYLIIIRIYVTCSHYLHDCGPTSWSILFYVVDLVSGVHIQTDPNKNQTQINKIENRKIEILLHFFGSLL